VCGTPGYIAPEVYLQGSAAADARSDIYSFGLVMWQMAGGSWTPPFHVAPQGDLSRYLSRIYDLQTGGPAPRIETPLWDMIERALQVDPARRYGSFAELREDLAALLRRETGRAPAVPCQPPPDADFWNNRGISLECLGRSKQAVDCYDKAIAADASHTHAWTNKGFALRGLGRHEQALHCFDRALAIDTGFAYAWHGRAGVLTSLQRYEEALDNYRRALQTDPDFYVAWGGQAHVLSLLGQYEQAEACYDEVLRRDRRNVEALTGKALGLERQGRLEEALSCLDQATAWNKIDPALWNNKGGILHGLGEYEKALVCYDEAIVIDDNFVMAWENKARVLISLGRFAQALECLEEVFRRDAARTSALFLQAVCEDALGRPGATASYRRFLAHAVADDPNLEVARQRLTSLECP
jgi:tetratricopeptide (TPR) repeat protein